MKKLYPIILITLSFATHAQSIIGQWETFDDKTKEKKALIEIYKTNNFFFAKIVESYVGDNNAVCDRCKGSKKDQPIKGLIIIENIKKNGDEFNDGTILDPENGKTYKCYLELIHRTKLKVRGYLGVSFFGRTQYWIKKE